MQFLVPTRLSSIVSQPNKIVVVVAVNVIVFVVTLVTDDIVVALKVGQNWISDSLNIKFLFLF